MSRTIVYSNKFFFIPNENKKKHNGFQTFYFLSERNVHLKTEKILKCCMRAIRCKLLYTQNKNTKETSQAKKNELCLCLRMKLKLHDYTNMNCGAFFKFCTLRLKKYSNELDNRDEQYTFDSNDDNILEFVHFHSS